MGEDGRRRRRLGVCDQTVRRETVPRPRKKFQRSDTRATHASFLHGCKWVLAIMHSETALTETAPDNEDILFKDSVYTAIGLAADILHDKLDFDSFITKTLVPEAQKQKPGFNIIRRRIAIIISQWISIKIAKDKKPIVYQIFQHLMDKSDLLNDQVVRVTAGRKFKDCADEWEFNADNFLPYAPVMLERLMALVQEVELPETKMALLNTISVIVERLEHHVRISMFIDRSWTNSSR